MASTRNRLHTDERRGQLLELGLDLFSARAYEDVSIDDIAEAGGISKGLLYHYFGGKRAFYIAVVEAASESLLKATAPNMKLPPVERARTGLLAYLDFIERRHQAFQSLLQGGGGGANKEVLAIVEGVRTTMVDRMLTSLGLEEPRPLFRTMARGWASAVEAACLDWIKHKDIDREILIQLLLGQLVGTIMVARRLDPEANLVVEPDWMLYAAQLMGGGEEPQS